MRAFFSFLLLAGLSLTAVPAQAERRIALVIGNDAYAHVTPLECAVADARSYRDTLSEKRGFEVVFAENADRQVMVGKVGEFLGRIQRGDVAIVVFSGHGVQLDPNDGNTLYLLPTDVPSVDPGAGRAAFFLDSQVINFAAAPGELALDYLPNEEGSKNPVFTRVFLKYFEPGTYLEDIANDVQAEVLELSRQASYQQRPYYSDGVAGKACLDDACGAPAPAATAQADNLEGTFWRLCETRDTASYCKAYLDAYPEGPHALLAPLRVDELEGTAAATDGASQSRVVALGTESQTEAQLGAAQEVEPALNPVLASVDPVEPVPAIDPGGRDNAAGQQEAAAAWAGLAESWDIRAIRDYRVPAPRPDLPDAAKLGSGPGPRRPGRGTRLRQHRLAAVPDHPSRRWRARHAGYPPHIAVRGPGPGFGPRRQDRGRLGDHHLQQDGTAVAAGLRDDQFLCAEEVMDGIAAGKGRTGTHPAPIWCRFGRNKLK